MKKMVMETAKLRKKKKNLKFGWKVLMFLKSVLSDLSIFLKHKSAIKTLDF